MLVLEARAVQQGCCVQWVLWPQQQAPGAQGRGWRVHGWAGQGLPLLRALGPALALGLVLRQMRWVCPPVRCAASPGRWRGQRQVH